MSQRVLLLFPQLNNLVFFGVYEPLVMEIFSAIAKEEGCEVELVDLRVDPHGCERLARRGYVPDLIGLTTHGFPEVPIVNRIARNCKKLVAQYRRWSSEADRRPSRRSSSTASTST